MDNLFWRLQQVHVFTDQRKVSYVFSPLTLRPNSPRHLLSKVHRWAIRQSWFAFFINYFKGTTNVCADLRTRWSNGYRSVTAQWVADLCCNIVPASNEIEIVAIEKIIIEQKKYAQPVGISQDGERIYRNKMQLWIQTQLASFQLWIIVEVHCESGGSRAHTATMNTIVETYWCLEVKKNVREFMLSCIHCIVSRTGERILRPLERAIHGTEQNEVVHADFLYMGPPKGINLKYVLLIKEDISSYTWLCPCESLDRDAATSAFFKSMACLKCMKCLVTDQGSHSVPSPLNNLTKEARICHHLTTRYWLWANGTVERHCRKVLRIAKDLLSK